MDADRVEKFLDKIRAGKPKSISPVIVQCCRECRKDFNFGDFGNHLWIYGLEYLNDFNQHDLEFKQQKKIKICFPCRVKSLKICWKCMSDSNEQIPCGNCITRSFKPKIWAHIDPNKSCINCQSNCSGL